MQLEKIRAAAERVARSEGLEIHDVEWKVGRQRFLRITLDRPWPTPDGSVESSRPGAGITHADCQRVSEQLSTLLDVEELVPGGSYILEVSSPGMDRQLLRPAEYQRFAGRLAQLTLTEPVEGATFYEARLAGFTEGPEGVAVKIEPKPAGKHRRNEPAATPRVVSVPFNKIKKAHLVVEL